MRRDVRSTECTAPFQYYVCQKNGFSGCCSDTRVCDLDDCPASSKPSPTSSIHTLTRVYSVVSAAVSTAAPHPSTTVSTPASKASATPNGFASDTSVIVGDTAAASHKSSKTPIIAGTVGGILGLLFFIAVVALLRAFLKRRKKRNEDEKRMMSYYVPPGARFEGQENGNGIGTSRNSKWKFTSIFTRSSLVSSLTSPRSMTHEKVPLSPMSASLGPEHATTYADGAMPDMRPELAGTLQDVTPELSSDASFNGRAELANPERLLINGPKSTDSSPTKSEHTDLSSAGDHGSIMGSNLNTARNSQGTGARRTHPHVMSWMDYNGDAGPYQ